MKKRMCFAVLAAVLLLISGCRGPSVPAGAQVSKTESQALLSLPPAVSVLPEASDREEPQPQPTASEQVLAAMEGTSPKRAVTKEFLDWCAQKEGDDFLPKLLSAIRSEGYSDGLFFRLTGRTLVVLNDEYTGALSACANIRLKEAARPDRTVLGFTGDVNLADGWYQMNYYDRQPDGIYGCLGGDLLSEMNGADVMLVNNEFSFSTRGAPLSGKLYTFRAHPKKVEILTQMGVDLVGLANNHIYDYGQDAFFDTLDTIDGAGIARVGAGRDLQEACTPQYYIVNGRKIAYVAATRAEKNIMTPAAGTDKEGVLRTYDPALFLQVIAEAKENSDFVVAYVHWGTENSTKLEAAQRTQGKQYIDAGADLVVGAHPHVLQGMEFYRDKPIFYSLGNFWFNDVPTDTALLKVLLDENGAVTPVLVPCYQGGGRTDIVTDPAERTRLFSHLERISIGVDIDETGTIRPAG